MINTVDIKRARDSVFTLESAEPKATVLIIGSCRCVAYLNYFARYNEMTGHKLRVHFIEPNDYCVDFAGNGLADLPKAEENPRVLDVIRSANIFLHEHYESYGMFNTNREMEKNIYQFGMQAPIDVSIPNFHDRFILFTEQRQFTPGLDVEEMKFRGLEAVEGFCKVCRQSSFMEFSAHFRETWTKLRYFWTGNHISRHFHLYIFRRLNEHWLKLPLSQEFWNGAATEDLFKTPHTPVTPEDIEAYGLQWPAEDL
jgi:hypothetical protein